MSADLAVFEVYGVFTAAFYINIAINGHAFQCDTAVFHIAVNIEIFPYGHVFRCNTGFCHSGVAVSAAAVISVHSHIAVTAGFIPIVIIIGIIGLACAVLCFHCIRADAGIYIADINSHGIDVTAAADADLIFYHHIFYFCLGEVDGSLIGIFGDFHIFDSGVRTQFQIGFRIQCQVAYFCVDGNGAGQFFIHYNICIIAVGKFTDFLKCGFFHSGLAAGFHCGILLIHNHFFDVTVFQDDFAAAIHNEFAFDSHIFQCDGLCAQAVGNGQITRNSCIFQFGLGQEHIFFFGFFFIFFLVARLIVHGLIQCQNGFRSCEHFVRPERAIGIACHNACFADSAYYAFCPIGNGVGIGITICPAVILFQTQNTRDHRRRFLSGDRVIGTESTVAVAGNIACRHTCLDGVFAPVMVGYVREISIAALAVSHGVIDQHYKLRSGNHVVGAESTIRIAADVSFIHPLIDSILCPVSLNVCGRTESGDAHSHGSRQHSCNGNRMFLLHNYTPI